MHLLQEPLTAHAVDSTMSHPKYVTASTMKQMAIATSAGVCGVTSPYPMVVMVVVAN